MNLCGNQMGGLINEGLEQATHEMCLGLRDQSIKCTPSSAPVARRAVRMSLHPSR